MQAARVLELDPATRADLDQARDRREPNLVFQYVIGLLFFVLANLAFGAMAIVVQLVSLGEIGASIEPWPALAVGLLVYAAVAVALNVVLVRWLAQRRVLEFGWSGWLREFGAGLSIGAGLIAASVGAVALLGGYRVSGVHVGTGVLVGIGIGIGAGFAEEILFRGVLLRLLDKNLGSWPAIAIVSVMFGLLHVTNSGAGWFGALALIIEAGLLLCGAYLLTRRLWLAVGIHVGWNITMSSIFGINVSGTGIGSDGLLLSSLSGPDWLTGGSMGLEGSAVTIVIAFAAGVAMLVAARRRGNLRERVGRDAPLVDLRPTKKVDRFRRT